MVSEQVLSFALDVADRVLVIENGEIVRDDARDERRCRADFEIFVRLNP